MTVDDLIVSLQNGLPEALARDLAVQFLAIRQDTITGTLERAAPGKPFEGVYFNSGIFARRKTGVG